MQVETDEIAGYHCQDGSLYCVECMAELEIEFEDPNRILFADTVEAENSLFWCDNCKERIK